MCSPPRARIVFDPGAEEEMVGVAQDELGPELLDLAVGQALDRALGGDRSEGRGEDRSVGGLDRRRPGRAASSAARVNPPLMR